MNTTTTTTNKSGIIVAFHIGRGGRFNNPGHKTFIGEKQIGDFADDLFIRFENELEIYSKIKGRENLEKLYYTATDNCEGAEAAIAKFATLGMVFGEKEYFTSTGEKVGLTLAEAAEGVGSIDIDGDYDYTYSTFIEDCSVEELEIIAKSTDYKSSELEEYMKEAL